MARYTCDTCAHDCSSMADFDAHLAEIARRRTLWGPTWALDSLKGQYRPRNDADVIAGGQHDDDQEGDLSAAQ